VQYLNGKVFVISVNEIAVCPAKPDSIVGVPALLRREESIVTRTTRRGRRDMRREADVVHTILAPLGTDGPAAVRIRAFVSRPLGEVLLCSLRKIVSHEI
jgi:hypothetical protein